MQPKYYRITELTCTPARRGKPATVGRYPVGRSTLWRWVTAGEFPAPIKLAGGTTAWLAEDLDRFDAERAAVRVQPDAQRKAGAASVAARRAKREAAGVAP